MLNDGGGDGVSLCSTLLLELLIRKQQELLQMFFSF